MVIEAWWMHCLFDNEATPFKCPLHTLHLNLGVFCEATLLNGSNVSSDNNTSLL